MDSNDLNLENVLEKAKTIGKDVLNMQYGVDVDEIKQQYIDNSGNLELAYSDLCSKMNKARTNAEFIECYEGFSALHSYSDSWKKAKECLDKLSFNDPKELRFLGVSYLSIGGVPYLDDLGNECIRASIKWQEYEDDYAEFYEKYNSRPKLLKLWDRFSTLIIIIGIVTLLNGFVFYFGAVLLEFIFRGIYTAVKRKSDEYKETLENLTERKQEVDKALSELRNR